MGWRGCVRSLYESGTGLRQHPSARERQKEGSKVDREEQGNCGSNGPATITSANNSQDA